MAIKAFVLLLLAAYNSVEAQYDPIINFCRRLDHQCKSNSFIFSFGQLLDLYALETLTNFNHSNNPQWHTLRGRRKRSICRNRLKRQ
jgi:hypothetical protein